MPKPNFLFIGPSKSASTWLFAVLGAHAEVFLPPAKDIYFFDRYYERGLDWYLSFFKDAPDTAKIVGEICHDYLHTLETIERIKGALPNAKLMTTLRHPLERAVSEYREMYQAGLVSKDFERGLADHPEILDHSHYATDLPPWQESFPADSLLIQNFDTLQSDPEAFARSVLTFLDLPWQENLPVSERVRGGGAARNRGLSRLVKLGAQTARGLGLATLVGRLKSNPAIRKTLYRAFREGEAPGPSQALADHLLTHFESDVQLAEHIFKTPLPHWRRLSPLMLGSSSS